MLLLLLLIGGTYGQDLLTPVEAVPTPGAPEELNLRNETPEPSDSDSKSEEPREGKSIASPIPPPLAHPPPVPGAIFRDSPVVHPVPHGAGPPPPPLAGGPPPPPAPPIFHDSPVVHPAPPPPPPPGPEPVYTDRLVPREPNALDILYFPISVFLHKCFKHETRKMNKYVNYFF